MPVRSVRDLRIYIDSDVSMRTHVAKTVSSCFSALRQIRSIRRSITRPVLRSLVVSMVLTRLDCGSTTLAGLPDQLLHKLQSKCSSTTGVFGSEVRPHYATTPRSAFAVVPGAHRVLPGCSCISVSAWLGTDVSGQRASPGG